MFERTCVGLDVHAQTIVACALNPATGEVIRARMASEPAVALEWLGRFDPGSLQVVYEAGPTGFGLARHLREHGIDCLIAAVQAPESPRGARQNG